MIGKFCITLARLDSVIIREYLTTVLV